jgi:methionine synthase II (cobalamin-independent)
MKRTEDGTSSNGGFMIPNKVHFVGSIALDSVEEVFATLGTSLGRRLRRVPDGEPGGRRLWISWQYPLLRAQHFLKADTTRTNQTTGFLPLGLAENVEPTDVRFGELGYAREARASYEDFLAARKSGKLSAETKFQVALPTPFAVIFPMCLPKDEPTIEAAYERAMLHEVGTICRAISHEDLCIQWDVCIEMILWDGRATIIRNPFANVHDSVVERLQVLSRAVPKDVELGFHLCYGDWEAKHFIEPEDAGKLVEVANALAEHVDRPITYIHMPVPADRFDDSYYKPLTTLRLSPKTELYLGLVHPDGAENTRRRIAAAANYVKDFGIATECGIARARSPELVKKIIKIHAEVSGEPSMQAKV